jgi:hypothetical protein
LKCWFFTRHLATAPIHGKQIFRSKSGMKSNCLPMAVYLSQIKQDFPLPLSGGVKTMPPALPIKAN